MVAARIMMHAGGDMASVLDVQVRTDLDALKCATPDCDCGDTHALILRAPCHLKAGLRPHYYRGRLYFECAKCGDLVTVIAVADTDTGEDPPVKHRTTN